MMHLAWMLFATALCYASAVLDQSGLWLQLGGVGPNGHCAAAAVWLLCGPRGGWGVSGAALIGLSADLLGAGRLGPAMALFTLSALSLDYLRPHFHMQSFPLRLAFAAMFSLFAFPAVLCQSSHLPDPSAWLRLALLQSALTSVVACPWLLLFRRVR